MGCFHAGHLQLMRWAKAKAKRVVVSLFVNPTQFGPTEDFSRYPRQFAADRDAAEEEGVDLLFAPTPEAMYPQGFQTDITVHGLSQGLCGKDRPGHFRGVTTVVGKLFNLVKPDVAIFGEKDLQQLAVIRQMVRDLNWDIKIFGHPIVREEDGLAMSSRNTYLSPEERRSALRLSRTLHLVREEVAKGEKRAPALLGMAQAHLVLDNTIKTDYIEIVDQHTLTGQEVVDQSSILAMAVKIGRTRLIDNGHLLVTS